MEYRKACSFDAETLVMLRKRQLEDESPSSAINIDAQLAEYFESSVKNGSIVVWLACDGEDAVASAGVCFYRLPPTFSNPSGYIAYITNIYTKNEYRRRGIASHMLTLVINEAKMRGCTTLRLHASAEGYSIYKKAGFVDSGGYMKLLL